MHLKVQPSYGGMTLKLIFRCFHDCMLAVNPDEIMQTRAEVQNYVRWPQRNVYKNDTSQQRQYVWTYRHKDTDLQREELNPNVKFHHCFFCQILNNTFQRYMHSDQIKMSCKVDFAPSLRFERLCAAGGFQAVLCVVEWLERALRGKKGLICHAVLRSDTQHPHTSPKKHSANKCVHDQYSGEK